jgi:polysaccharide export outer membrane protein
MKNKQLIVFMILILVMVCSGYSQGVQGGDYRIGAQDELEISAVGVKELNKVKVRVSEDGLISLPLVGEVKVVGLTRSAVEQKIARLLEEKYVQNAQVTIFITEFASKKVSVLGAVTTPGSYPLMGRMRLMHIISAAGGLKPSAGNEIIIIRELEDGSSTSIKISINDLFISGDSSLNITIHPGDVVNIPEDKIVLIYVFGQVKKPSALQVKRSNIPTLLQAIATAGGFSDRAKKSGVIIKWTDKAGKEHQKKVNVKNILKGKIKDIQLKENDTVYVPETIF